jgi:hypothetical protein
VPKAGGGLYKIEQASSTVHIDAARLTLCSVSLPGVRRKTLLELSGHAIEFFRIRRRLALDRDVRPDQRIVGIQLEPALEAGLGVREDRLSWAFGLAHTAVDALIGVNDEHVLALVEAVDRADFHAIHVLALDAVVGDDEGQGTLLGQGRSGR